MNFITEITLQSARVHLNSEECALLEKKKKSFSQQPLSHEPLHHYVLIIQESLFKRTA